MWFIVTGLIASAVFVGYCVYTAPHGYEDDTGFHFDDEWDGW